MGKHAAELHDADELKSLLGSQLIDVDRVSDDIWYFRFQCADGMKTEMCFKFARHPKLQKLMDEHH